jgi:hypothetical protein
MPSSLWVEALHTATFLINIRPTNTQTHHFIRGLIRPLDPIQLPLCVWLPLLP